MTAQRNIDRLRLVRTSSCRRASAAPILARPSFDYARLCVWPFSL